MGQVNGQGGVPGRPALRLSLGPNQCAICQQEGHWKNECPNEGNLNLVEDTNVMLLEEDSD